MNNDPNKEKEDLSGEINPVTGSFINPNEEEYTEPEIEDWADFAGRSEEAKWYVKEQQDQILEQYGCKAFDELPEYAQKESLLLDKKWAYEWGGNGQKFNKLYHKENFEQDEIENDNDDFELE